MAWGRLEQHMMSVSVDALNSDCSMRRSMLSCGRLHEQASDQFSRDNLMDAKLPESMERLIAEIEGQLHDRPKLARMFRLCFANTLQTTVRRLPDQTTFVITGDIPAMWLRDST